MKLHQQITGDSKLGTIEENIKPKYECNCSSEKFEKD